MSAIETSNLIDFSMEDDGQNIELNLPPQQNTGSSPSNTTTVISEKTSLTNMAAVASTIWLPIDASIISSTHRESLDNNPFDRVESLANRPNDPFESLEKEATEKGKALLPRQEVELGNLLSISDDNLINDDQRASIAERQYNSLKTKNNITSTVTPMNTSVKCVNSSDCLGQSNGPNFCTNLLDIGSPPVSNLPKTTQNLVNFKDKASYSGSNSGNLAKAKKVVEHRKRLLKFSLSNSAFSSPVSRNDSQESNESSPELKSSSEQIEVAESLVKMSEEDLMAEEPNWIDSEKDFEAELEMLNIPMLKELPSPENDILINERLLEQQQEVVEKPLPNIEKHENLQLTDLDAIRSKLKAKQNERCNSVQDISKIIDNLKSLICNRENDGTIQQQASSLLDTLSTAFGSKSQDDKNAKQNEIKQENLELPPQPIKRQGTFDIDLQENKQRDQQEVDLNNDKIPDAMIKSSATFDDEMSTEKVDSILPEEEPHFPQSSRVLPQAPHYDINDIAEQIGKLLGLHQLNNKHNNETSSEVSSSSSLNPTVIVVMNTSSMVMQQSTCNSSQLEISTINDGSSDLTHSNNAAQRRRSQSLSIHDKIKVLHLPLMTSNSNSETKAHSSSPLDVETLEFKTPSHSKLRRNSFSNATHSIRSHSNNQRRMSCASDGVVKPRHYSVLSTHHEQQQHLKPPTAAAVIHPIPQLSDVNTKRKLRSNAAVNSILKSTGPMKATIPVKKVSPMIKTSPHTPEDVKSSKIKTASNNTSTRAEANISTPTSSSQTEESVAIFDVATGFPSACSTPAADRGSVRQRSLATGEYKPRFSYLPTTPTARQMATPLTTTAVVKRRTITELKSKSPIKPRVSTTAMNCVKAMTAINPTTTRSTQKSPQKKTVNKGAPTAKNPVRTTRTSFGGATGAYRNKENKKP